MTERLLYDDEQGLELVHEALSDAIGYLHRSVTAAEVTSQISKGSPKHWDDQDVRQHEKRVHSLLEKLAEQHKVCRTYLHYWQLVP